MTDQPQQPAAPTPSPVDPTAAQAPAGKSPLEMLEEMLQATQAQQPAATPAPTQTAAAPAPQAGATPPVAEPQLDPAVIAQAQADSNAQDQVDLKAKLEELKTISQTPEYQARVAQNQAAVNEEAQQQSAIQGYEIHQLDHKKITE